MKRIHKPVKDPYGLEQYPPNLWIKVVAYRCSNCGEIIVMRPQTMCPTCRADMEGSVV